MKKLIVMMALLFAPAGAWAHHGGVSLAFGPGSPVETNAPLTLPEGGFVTGLRVEQVDWKKNAAGDVADNGNKTNFTFLSANMSYGFTPALMGTFIVPYYIKHQEGGTNQGLADVKLQLTYGFHYDPATGFSRNKAEDTAVSLENQGNRTWLAISAMASIPNGDHNKTINNVYDTGMQSGFGAPAYTLGLSAARAFGSLTLNGEVSADIFTPRGDVNNKSFQYGSEFRTNLAGVYELYGNSNSFLSKLDGILELNYLHLDHDRADGSNVAESGGDVLYLSPGLRFSFPSLQNANLGVLVKLPVWKSLNNQSEQQGSEGLENFRLITTLSLYF